MVALTACEVAELGRGESGCGGLGDLDGDDLGEGAREGFGEEAYAGVEVPRECASGLGVAGCEDDESEEFGEEEAVDLEKGGARDPVSCAGDLVVEAGCAPGWAGTWDLGAAAAVG